MDTTSHRSRRMEELGDSVECEAAPDDFAPLCVMEFGRDTGDDVIEWILSKIQASESKGGGALWARAATDSATSIVYLGARTSRLLAASELMELKKVYHDGSLREVTLADLHNFQDAENIDSFLSMAEKQRIILHEMESIRIEQEDAEYIPMKLNFYFGQAIIPKCITDGVITKLFPLHNKDELKRLGGDWYWRSFLSNQPLDRVRAYFGETISVYFAFLGFYTMALVPPALIGVIASLLSLGNGGFTNQVCFSALNLVWATLFLEAWKRRSAVLSYTWGMSGVHRFQRARPGYHGVLGVNPVTRRREPRFPKWRCLARFYGVTVPAVAACLGVATLVMLAYFSLQHAADEYHRSNGGSGSGVLRRLPSILYAVVITIMNVYYKKLARFLNDYENHRLQSAYDNHYISKLILFNFANCFMSLFYVAFYLQDLVLLQSHLATLLIMQQVIDQLVESVLPYLVYKRRKLAICRGNKQPDDCRPLVATGDNLRTSIEASKDAYEGTLDDYLELFVQFGYVFLFSSVFPTAALWALLNNITEMRTDAFKLCRIFQRPFSQPAAGIGVWQIAFEVMSVMAVMTNFALIALSPGVRGHFEKWGAVNSLLLFVAAEHIVLLCKLLLAHLIPDEPGWVSTALSRVEYDANQAWRKHRIEEAKHLLKCGKGSIPTNVGKLD